MYLADELTPAEGWAKFLDANDKPEWSETVIAGGSLGAGMAVLIAEQHLVHRVSLFAGWTDARHGWVKRVATPAENYFSLIHVRDNFYERTCWAYKDLGLRRDLPDAESALADREQRSRRSARGNSCSTSSRSRAKWSPATSSTPARHAMAPSGRRADGVTPVRTLVNAWRSILGDSDADTLARRARQLRRSSPTPSRSTATTTGSATPAARRSPRARPADRCRQRSRSRSALPAAFAAFTPGVDRSYDATTTATVISTAGDAALSVHDAERQRHRSLGQRGVLTLRAAPGECHRHVRCAERVAADAAHLRGAGQQRRRSRSRSVSTSARPRRSGRARTARP